MSAKSATNIKVLLSPQRLLKAPNVIELMEIVDTGRSKDYYVYDPNIKVIRKLLPKLPDAVKLTLANFDSKSISDIENGITEKYKKSRAGVAFDSFFDNAYSRAMHELFTSIKPFASLFSWYQKIESKLATKTNACSLSTFWPGLKFNVYKNDKNNFCLQTLVQINEGEYPVEDFLRYEFLIQSNTEYFILRYGDYHTLKWLDTVNWDKLGNDGSEFLKTIVNKLEENYSVNRNNLFEQTFLEVEPINRVMLSELSNSFLMLTPQWIYDSEMVEGVYQETISIKGADKEIILKRNKEKEDAFVHKLLGLHANFKNQLSKGYFYLSFSDAQKGHWFLKTYQKLLAEDIEISGMDLLKHFRYSPHKATTSLVQGNQQNQWITFDATVAFGKELVPLAHIQKTLLSGQKVVMLKDGSFGVFDDEWLAAYSTIFKHGKVDKKQIRIAKWMAISERAVESSGNNDEVITKPIITPDWWNKWRRWQSSDDIIYKVPEVVNATLRPYQQKGYEWMTLLSESGAGACLADDMGLGKTLQTICFLTNQLELNPTGKCLIITPASLIYNWLDEWTKFAPSIKVEVHHGSGRSGECFINDAQIIITSYGAVRVDVEGLKERQFLAVIIDESHNIKNPSAQITRAVMEVNGQTRIALSGTPVMNNTFDLYSQLNYALPGLYGSREFFKREYADPIDLKADKEKADTLRRITAPFILRRTKSQVATDLPMKTETVLWCEMSPNQRDAYDTVRDSVRNNIYSTIESDGLQKGKLGILNGLLKLRQMCNSGELVKHEDVFNYDSIKTDMLIEELQNIIPHKHKAIVFSQFTSMLDLLERDFEKAGITYLRLDGTIASKERKNLVNEFQAEDSTCNVFLISLKAGNAGLNLVAADYVFLFDPWWNKAVENQAIDRVHRIGQTKPVYAYKMVCKGTVEEKIIALQSKKQITSDSLITEEEGFVKNLDLDDIDFLLS
ncbi:DEAD/DEAH box helicase [Polluticaenibacter yanchengensis]|uniref:DEAD/DEAH box helicase n=1 Tax=Polluticaenibacter yanchengensis TaxID=3014562 RepID=A0ABT4UH51_9BACT|nr:DEAD/DEAH box helicase [Chitinophagaceae bacterium LY-5]